MEFRGVSNTPATSSNRGVGSRVVGSQLLLEPTVGQNTSGGAAMNMPMLAEAGYDLMCIELACSLSSQGAQACRSFSHINNEDEGEDLESITRSYIE